MNKAEFEKIVQNKPVIVAVFRVTSVPSWLVGRLLFGRPEGVVGDEVYYVDQSTVFHVKNRCNYGIGASYLKFVEYRQIMPNSVPPGWRF